MSESSPFTGYQRPRKTPRGVRIAESVARWLISLGGIGTIVSVSLIFLFLVWVVLPLFASAELEHVGTDGEALEKGRAVVAIGADEHRIVGWVLHTDGTLRTFRTDTGESLAERRLFPASATAWSTTPFKGGVRLCVGFDDGTVRTGVVTFRQAFPPMEDLPAELRKLGKGERARYRDTMGFMTPGLQFRVQELVADLDESFAAIDGSIAAVDYTQAANAHTWAVLGVNGQLRAYILPRRAEAEGAGEEDEDDMLGGPRRLRVDLPYTPDKERGAPLFLGVNGGGLSLVLLWSDGHLERYTLNPAYPDPKGPVEAQTIVEEGRHVTAVRFLLGKGTLLVGDSRGRVRAWFETKPQSAGTLDRIVLRAARTFEGDDSPVRTFATSARTRLAVLGYESGELRLVHVTTGELLATVRVEGAVRQAAFLPKNDGLLATSAAGLTRWDLDPGHPEATIASMFGRVWYEGYAAPDSGADEAADRGYVWQSTGPDGFEPKYSLVPLIFGTIKATVYSILIAAPIAFLAALFTAEFLSPRLRSPIKSAVEMMAGLPSVVLGFLAALVIAPHVQTVVPAMLAAFATVPFMLLLGARGWQLLPTRRAVQWGGAPRFLMITAMIPLGIWLAGAVGPWLENRFFWVERDLENGGTSRVADMRQWLATGTGAEGTRSSGAGGWLFLLLPAAALVVTIVWTLFGAPALRAASGEWSRRRCAIADIVKFVLLGVAVVGSALAAGLFLERFGVDPRGGVLDAYAQRNALIVGFVMGFAVVPIIYTLAEDALSSVPPQLREGSLGCGATPWQTAWRITIPTAMSGLFGALMVGLGRAVGETMIVLMAAGNTGIMDWNMFNGFRTLSANIATEMPEAPKDGTHYRTLFLAALVLFAMTFLINTVAEGVRRVFRRRFQDL